MGIEIAREAHRRGWGVTLVLGPVEIPPPVGVSVVSVESAAEMATAVAARFGDCDAFVATAAVADYTPARRVPGKLKKAPGGLSLDLVRTTDILAWAGEQRRRGQTLVGFALEADANPLSAMVKLRSKRCDLIVHNTPSNFGDAQGVVTILNSDGPVWSGTAPKAGVAVAILDQISVVRVAVKA